MENLLQFINLPFMICLIAATETLMNINFIKQRVDARILNKVIAFVLMAIFYGLNLNVSPENFESIIVSFALSVWAYDDIVEPFKMLFGLKKKQ